MRAIAGDTIKAQPLVTRRLPVQRRHASTVAATKATADDIVPFAPTKSQPKHNSLAKEVNIPTTGIKLTPSTVAKPDWHTKTRPNAITIENRSALLKELEWLPDRVKLAEHVHYVLRCNDPEKALNLCRLASKKEEVIVSWNHVVDWFMQKNRVAEALKTYNEMKKRGQFPDAYTYTLLLRGLGRQPDLHPKIKSKMTVQAISIYNSMSSPASRVKPNLFHTNSVLKVCSEGGDMDGLWGIVARLPDRGPSAPDHVTYCTILRAIRQNTFGYEGHKKHVLEAIPARQDRALSEARAVWRDTIARWRAGEVKIDEQLVVEMGSLLLSSSRIQDWDDVLNLIQQTMDIERVVPPLGSPDRKVQHVPQAFPIEQDAVQPEDADGWVDTPPGKAFLPVKPWSKDSTHFRRTLALAWAQPSNHTLNLVLDACTQLRTSKGARDYWDVLVSGQHNIRPDHRNFHTMLRVLHKNRASKRAIALVQDTMASAGREPNATTYFLAMATCVRDKDNAQALDHASLLIKLMAEHCDPTTSTRFSIQAVVLYLNLSLSADSPANIVKTLHHVHPIMEKLRLRVDSEQDHLEGDLSKIDKQRPETKSRDTQTVLHLFRNASGIIQALLDFNLVSPETSKILATRKSLYDRYIGQINQPAKTEDKDSVSLNLWRRPMSQHADSSTKDGGVRDEEDGPKMALGGTEAPLRAFRRRHTAMSGRSS